MKRVQTLFRLWDDDLVLFKSKAAGDKLSIQKVMECLVKEYLKDNAEVTKLVRKYSHVRNDKKRRYSVDEFEVDAILKRLQEVSPLKDLDNAFRELDNENSDHKDR